MSLFSMCMKANFFLGFNIIVVRLLDYGQIAFSCYYFLGITVVRGELTIVSFSIVFFFLSLFSYYVLCQLSTIPSIIFYILLSLFLRHFQCNPRRNFGLPRLHFPSTFWASALFAICLRDQAMCSSPISSKNFSSLQPPLSFHPISLANLNLLLLLLY